MEWWIILLRIGVATAVGTAVGLEREIKHRPAGLRTHVLVCLGACVIALIEDSLAARIAPGGNVEFDMGRIAAQVVSGIGFLGAGTIFTARRKITGLTTAASLWNVACLGIAVGYGLYFIVLGGVVCMLLVLVALQRVVPVNNFKRLEVRFVHRVETIEFLNQYFERQGIAVLDIDFRADSREGQNVYTNTYTLKMPATCTYAEIVNALSEHTNVVSIQTINT